MFMGDFIKERCNTRSALQFLFCLHRKHLSFSLHFHEARFQSKSGKSSTLKLSSQTSLLIFTLINSLLIPDCEIDIFFTSIFHPAISSLTVTLTPPHPSFSHLPHLSSASHLSPLSFPISTFTPSPKLPRYITLINLEFPKTRQVRSHSLTRSPKIIHSNVHR
jgi:hypothetical protein